MKKVFVFIIYSQIVISQGSYTDDVKDSTKTYTLSEIAITATRYEKNTDEIGRSVTVINKEQMKNFLYRSIGEMLSQQAGIYVIGGGQNPGMNQTLFIRGTASHQAAILVDGIRLTDPSTINDIPDLTELSLANIDHLEIVRGAHSTLYGSSAVGGVINLISKTAESPGIHLNADVSSGIFGEKTFTHSENLFLNYSNENGLYFNTEFSNAMTKGLDATVDTVSTTGVFKNRDKDNFKKTDFSGKIGFKTNLFDFYFSSKNLSQKADLDKGAYVDDDNSTLDFKRNLFAYGVSYTIASGRDIKYIGGYSDMKRTAKDDSSIVDALGNYDHTYNDAHYKGTTMTNELQANITTSKFVGLFGVGRYVETMGAQTRLYSWSSFGIYESSTNLDTLNSKSITNYIFFHADIYGSLVDNSLNNVSFAIGARYNHHNTFGDNITYEINPVYRIAENSLLFASYTTGFNTPSLYQLFAPDNYYTSTVTRGNKNLRPENSSSFETGIKYSLDRNFNFMVTYFNTVVKNYIEYVYLWDKNIGFDTLGNDFLRDDYRGDTYLNLGKLTTNGLEILFNAALSEQIIIAGNISFVSGKLTYNPSEIDLVQTEGNHVQLYSNGAFVNTKVEKSNLVRRPNSANFSLTYKPRNTLALRFDAKFVGSRNDVYYDTQLGPYGALTDRPVDKYSVFDFSLRFSINVNFSVSGRVENIFNTKYSEIRGFTTRGRGFYLNANLSL